MVHFVYFLDHYSMALAVSAVWAFSQLEHTEAASPSTQLLERKKEKNKKTQLHLTRDRDRNPPGGPGIIYLGGESADVSLPKASLDLLQQASSSSWESVPSSSLMEAIRAGYGFGTTEPEGTGCREGTHQRGG